MLWNWINIAYKIFFRIVNLLFPLWCDYVVSLGGWWVDSGIKKSFTPQLALCCLVIPDKMWYAVTQPPKPFKISRNIKRALFDAERNKEKEQKKLHLKVFLRTMSRSEKNPRSWMLCQQCLIYDPLYFQIVCPQRKGFCNINIYLALETEK